MLRLRQLISSEATPLLVLPAVAEAVDRPPPASLLCNEVDSPAAPYSHLK